MKLIKPRNLCSLPELIAKTKLTLRLWRLFVIVVPFVAREDKSTSTWWTSNLSRMCRGQIYLPANEVKRRRARRAPIGRRIEAPPGESPKKLRYHLWYMASIGRALRVKSILPKNTLEVLRILNFTMRVIILVDDAILKLIIETFNYFWIQGIIFGCFSWSDWD